MEMVTVDLGKTFDDAVARGQVQQITGLPAGHFAIAVPLAMTLKSLTDEIDKREERLAPGPRRIEGTEVAETLPSFIDLVNRHARASTAIFARGGLQPALTAVIDYHEESDGEEGPASAWRGQRVSYAFPFSPAFQAWGRAAMRGKVEFVAFVEDRIGDFLDPEELPKADPTASRKTLIQEVFDGVLRARGVERGKRAGMAFDQVFAGPARLLADVRKLKGISTQSVDEIEHGLGSVEITFTKSDKVQGAESVAEYYAIAIEVFPGSEPITMPVRLRASASGGALVLGFELIGVDRVIDAAFLEAVKRVSDETKRPVYRAELAK